MTVELTKAQFDLIATLLRSREDTRLAAYWVLVKGKPRELALKKVADKRRTTGDTTGQASTLSEQSLSNTLGRFRQTHAAILKAYSTD